MDSGTTNSFAIDEMVQKLGLKRLGHSCPYRIGWLQDDHALEVKE